MVETQVASEPGVVERVLVAAIEHSENWGKVWFGLIFWGSVLFAVAQRIWPDGNGVVMLGASLAIGLATGIAAHVRGYWL